MKFDELLITVIPPGDDFEKGPDQGSQAALQVIDHTARHLHYRV